MADKIRFFLTGNTLNITVPSSNMILGTSQPISIFITTDKAPVVFLQEIQTELSRYFVFEGGKTLDTIVEDIIVNLSVRKFDLKTISSIKGYAKYFYRLWNDKDKGGLSSRDTDEIRQTTSIVIDMLSWWYIRRLVHVYVICAILEEVYKSTNTQSHAYPLGSPSPPLAPPPTPLPTTTDMSTLLNSYRTLEIDYKTLYDSVAEKDAKIAMLQKKLDDFKELLIHSTSMIFKIEEVPNMIRI